MAKPEPIGPRRKVITMHIKEVFAGLAVRDIDAARDFYGSILGVDVRDEAFGVEGADVPGGLVIHAGSDSRILIYPKPDHEPAGFTVFNIVVEDIEAAVDQLIARGVRFEQYEFPKTDEKGIHRSPEVHPVAWLRDPSGNIVSLVEA